MSEYYLINIIFIHTLGRRLTIRMVKSESNGFWTRLLVNGQTCHFLCQVPYVLYVYVQYLYLAFKIQNMSSWNQKIMNVQYFSKLHILTRIVNCIRTRYNFIACFAESSVWLSLIVSKDLRSSNISWITQFNRLKRDINPNFQHRRQSC